MTNKSIHGITVSHFYETYQEKLRLELVTSGTGLHRLIREGSINRPSLALTGFFKYFANKRIQVLGAAEMTYFKSIEPRLQIDILNQMADRGIPCIVLTRNFNPTHAMLVVAEERKLPIFRTPMITMHWVNLATLCIDQEFSPVSTEHATTIDIKGMGVMIRGESGTGKSECALALIERGSLLVADDLTVIRVVEDTRLLASSRDLNRGYMECRGIGIINIAEMFGIRAIRIDKHIDLVITLREWTPEALEERTGLEESHYEILGIQIPHMEIYVRPGRDIARLVEVAAMVQALKKIGHDPAKEFNDRLIAYMEQQAADRERVIKPFRSTTESHPVD
ncbi:HPr(Ser) kinase/phosphatase [Opitutaceae bacterium TAV4]|uniref:HPr(Ser) kinase/phosphatase n=1 Tax=Geminisphaera colitermitum TaxID=1148786 RepID=UPI000158CE69|nr:HPr(Ser) kinase/phosphatase [Geminisphaera colitermitum]RRJ94239.1 HPr(Ser) kinase/phosphatase [Opitutaceae bacterium TAV4]RRJ98332.1 HPr(Ser) kinase/phosphatase [Opitutaceae bacterium TAV3]